jgi:hypothetical protein
MKMNRRPHAFWVSDRTGNNYVIYSGLILQVSYTVKAHQYCNNKPQERVQYAALSRVHAVLVPCQWFAQEAYLPVCYDQWWASGLAGSITSHTYPLSWKEAIAVSCPSKARQRARKAAVTSKWCQNSWTKRFQLKPYNVYNSNVIRNLITPRLKLTNEVCSR